MAKPRTNAMSRTAPRCSRAMKHFVAEAGGLDILVNNAVYFHYAPLVDMPEDKSTDARRRDQGVFWARRRPPASDRARRRQHHQSFVGSRVVRHYECLGLHLDQGGDRHVHPAAGGGVGAHGIRVNAIAPSVTLTERVKRLLAGNKSIEKLASTHLLGLGQPIHIANMAVYLASDEAEITTGQILSVDSGVTIY